VNTLNKRIRSLPRRSQNLTQVPGAPAMGAADHAPHQLVMTPGTVGLSPLSSLITSDGAAIPATGPGQWDQLHAAGRIK
jgi:hypothetical protein